ncbi:MAG: serine/threonine-protein kinase [Ktedonobacterales bacterium]
MPQSASQATLAPGTVLTRRYRIEQLIGSGGYASVYRASDLTFGYERAIKEVSDPDQGVRTQFRLEAELLINSRHPNIPHGYHLIEDMNRLFLVMDYVKGKDLEELLNESLTQRQRPLDEAQVLRWAVDISGALDEMHNLQVPVFHRDIKPANIKITPDGTPILIDFGLAKLHQKGPTMTAAQGVSPGFAPPEQYMAKGRTDARTDIYGLGATLYACLTGKDPPEAPSRLLAQTGAGGGGQSLIAPKRLNNRISDETDRIVMRALELSPANRQQSARELREDLSASLARLGKGGGEITMVMGGACPRCGTQNRPDATKCVHCGAPLRMPEGSRAGSLPNGTGKRTIAPAPPGLRTSAKVPAVPANRFGGQAQAEAGLEPRTGKQPALNLPQRTGKQPAVALDGRTGKQAALPALSEAGASSAAAVAAPALTREGTMVALPAKGGREVQGKANQPDLASQGRAWIRLGSTPLTTFGKVMLVLSAVEFVWGVFILVLGGVAIATRSSGSLPVAQLVLAWLGVIVVGSILGAQAVTRPIYRRNSLAPLRRWLQGIGLVVYSVAVHGVALWGANIFQVSQGNATLAILSFMLFGVNVLVVGTLAVINTLG